MTDKPNSDTPETEDADYVVDSDERVFVCIDHARRLERERDEARREAERLRALLDAIKECAAAPMAAPGLLETSANARSDTRRVGLPNQTGG